MGKEITDTRRIIKDPISAQKHAQIKEEFERRLKQEQKKYEHYSPSQKPSTESLIDIVQAEIAYGYFLRKHTISRIIQNNYRYEEAND